MEPFDKEKAYDEFMEMMSELHSKSTSISGAVRMVRAGQNYLQKIYHQGFNQGYEIATNPMEKKDDSNGQQ